MVDDGHRRTDRRQLDGYTISSPCEPNGSGELIKVGCKGVFVTQTCFRDDMAKTHFCDEVVHLFPR